jgi:PTS system ascorbate-specific IIA component
MSVGLLLITHGRLGDEMLAVAKKIVLHKSVRTATLGVDDDPQPERLEEQAIRLVNQLDDGSGVLVLADAFGATPCNVATRLKRGERIAVVAGLNLPMLVRVMNYADRPLPELAKVAFDGGQSSIVQCIP